MRIYNPRMEEKQLFLQESKCQKDEKPASKFAC